MPQILVVDDALLIRETFARLLQHEGYSAATAASGREAWAMLYRETPQLIILDLTLPQMDGLTFLSLLRHNTRWGKVPVVVLSGASDPMGLVPQAKKLGVVDIVSKIGAGTDKLLEDIRKVLCSPRETVKPMPGPMKYPAMNPSQTVPHKLTSNPSSSIAPALANKARLASFAVGA